MNTSVAPQLHRESLPAPCLTTVSKGMYGSPLYKGFEGLLGLSQADMTREYGIRTPTPHPLKLPI